MKIKFEGEGGVVSEQPRRFIEHWTLLSLPLPTPGPDHVLEAYCNRLLVHLSRIDNL